MKLTRLRPIIWTENLHETVDFYVKNLGFNCGELVAEWNWATLWKDDVSIMVSAPNDHTKFDKIGFTGSFYFTTEDINALWNELKDKAKICYEPETFEWGMREFGIYDNNGYLLQFGQNVEENL
jgi:uncharacterized glyoxalase superfamily protein PhnB